MSCIAHGEQKEVESRSLRPQPGQPKVATGPVHPSIALALAIDSTYSTAMPSTFGGIEALFDLLLLELSNEVDQVLDRLWGRVDVEHESLAVSQ